MPVIGRLDEQVEDVLINPVSKGRRGRETPANPGGTTDSRPAPPEPESPAPSQTPRPGESSAGAGELPVWLL